jgi:alkanesulfonate monooxygenase SsuD/methylene tetrahydromethanopterin reductase-like flavin-dependent oxidoreductase (luciferase family)
MKSIYFSLNPYRDLPDDFERRYESVYVTPPNDELCDPALSGQYYRETLDEYELASQLGFDGIAVNEHHQNAYGHFNSPNLFAAALVRPTQEAGTAIVVLGNTLPLYNPAIRVAEELAVLDVMSNGRVVAGIPVGTPMDTAYSYGVTPSMIRPRWHEARELMLRAWTEPGPFPFNGRFNQLRYVNPWPKPLQKPHPPVWLAGGTSIETFELAVENEWPFNYLSFGGYRSSKGSMEIFWRMVEEAGKDLNPYRAGFHQQIVVADTDEEAERLYNEHVTWFYRKSLHMAPHFASPPGYQTKRTKDFAAKKGFNVAMAMAEASKTGDWRKFIDGGFVIAGSPDTVAEQLTHVIKDLRFGHLIAGLQIGSMPTELTQHNIRLFAEEVLPRVNAIWDDEGWEDRWWPQGAKVPVLPSQAA